MTLTFATKTSEKPRDSQNYGRATILLTIFLSIAALSGCGGGPPTAETSSVALTIDQDANQNSAVELEIVSIYDEKLLEQLLQLPARQWFASRQQFQRDYPKGWTSVNWQVVPGQIIDTYDISDDADDAYGVLVFANYRTPGFHRARIGSFEDVTLILQKDGFLVTGE